MKPYFKSEPSERTNSQILAEAELANDYRYSTGTAFTSSTASVDYFRAKLAGRKREMIAVEFLNNQHQLLVYEEIFYGSIACVSVHPREIMRFALKYNAAAFILCHNHPSFWRNHPESISSSRLA
ncbi:hypothetical protein K5Y32_22115 [Pantoea sp. DY-15]|uniref:JAB domain-containing protein n=1 Tax=Pantoea sp. DY-15 TaxID=2871489 RepID=UPI001C96CD7E|nr:hypothetical protein [Pantoea sp. DY-15]